MPEGPSIVLLKEATRQFTGKKIIEVTGNSKENIQQLKGQTIIEFKSWGKHFLIHTSKVTARIHFLLFGSFRINEEADLKPNPRLCLGFKKGKLCFYACSVKFFTEHPDEIYNWTADVMSDDWNPRKARKKLKDKPEMLVCDALLNQEIFSGVGNIIKNEVLYRIKVHPESIIEKLPPKKLSELIKEARNYSFDFLHWKREYQLKKHWLAHTKRTCTRCDLPLIKKYCGQTKRRSFFCTNCQVLYH